MQQHYTDGLSQGHIDAGVLGGNHMLSYIPIHLSAVARSPNVHAWVDSWSGPETFSRLQAYNWFNKGHQAGHWLRCPPPTAANVALEQLATAVHKRPYTHHIVLILRLMMASWRTFLGKLCNLVFMVSLGTTMWPTDLFEPLVFGIFFPLLCYRPWQLRGCCQLGKRYFVRTFQPSEDFGLHVSECGMGNVIGQLTMGSSPLLGCKMRKESSWCRIMMKKDISCLLGMGTI